MYVLSKNKKTIKIFQLKIFNFLGSKKLCILHGRVFVRHDHEVASALRKLAHAIYTDILSFENENFQLKKK